MLWLEFCSFRKQQVIFAHCILVIVWHIIPKFSSLTTNMFGHPVSEWGIQEHLSWVVLVWGIRLQWNSARATSLKAWLRLEKWLLKLLAPLEGLRFSPDGCLSKATWVTCGIWLPQEEVIQESYQRAIFLYVLSPEATYLFLLYSLGHRPTSVPSCYGMERGDIRI